MNNTPESLGDSLAKLCPCLDCNLWIREDKKQLVVSANDWLSIPPMELIKRIIGPNAFSEIKTKELEYIEMMSQNMEIIQDEKEVYGRAFICDVDYYKDLFGRVTLGGFATCKMSGICGILLGKSTRASRDIGIPIISEKVLSTWVKRQVKLCINRGIQPFNEVAISEICSSLKEKSLELYIAQDKDGFMKYQDIMDKVRNTDIEEYIIVSDSVVEITKRDLPNGFEIEYLDNVLWCSRGARIILQTFASIPWPFENWQEWNNVGIETQVIEAILNAWEISDVEQNLHVIRPSEDIVCSAVIGKIEGKEWMVDHVIKVCRKEIVDK